MSDDVEEVGTEEVRGVDTTHYRGTIDLERALEQVPESVKPQVEAQLGGMGRHPPGGGVARS